MVFGSLRSYQKPVCTQNIDIIDYYKQRSSLGKSDTDIIITVSTQPPAPCHPPPSATGEPYRAPGILCFASKLTEGHQKYSSFHGLLASKGRNVFQFHALHIFEDIGASTRQLKYPPLVVAHLCLIQDLVWQILLALVFLEPPAICRPVEHPASID